MCALVIWPVGLALAIRQGWVLARIPPTRRTEVGRRPLLSKPSRIGCISGAVAEFFMSQTSWLGSATHGAHEAPPRTGISASTAERRLRWQTPPHGRLHEGYTSEPLIDEIEAVVQMLSGVRATVGVILLSNHDLWLEWLSMAEIMCIMRGAGPRVATPVCAPTSALCRYGSCSSTRLLIGNRVTSLILAMPA